MKYAITKNHYAGTACLTLFGPAEVITDEMLDPLITEWVKWKYDNPEDCDDKLWELHIKAQTTVRRDDLPFSLVSALVGEPYWMASLEGIDDLRSTPGHAVAVYYVVDDPTSYDRSKR